MINKYISQSEINELNDKEISFLKLVLTTVNGELLHKRFEHIRKGFKVVEEDINTLYKYVKYLTIYAITLNALIAGILLCLILTN